MSQHVGHEVVLRPAGMGTDGTLERFDPFMDPDVLLKVRAGPQERFITVRTLERLATYNKYQQCQKVFSASSTCIYLLSPCMDIRRPIMTARTYV